MHVTIPPELALYLEAEIAGGQIRSAEDGVVKGLELLRQRSKKLAELQSALSVGIDQLDRGDCFPMPADFAQQIIREGMARRENKGGGRI